VCWQCSKIETKPDLKQSIQNGVENINTAISKISQSKGYQFLSVGDEEGKSLAVSAEEGTSISAGDAESKSLEWQFLIDTIDLDLVAGIYDYQPDLNRHHHYYFPASLFKRTGESEHMIVNLPHRVVFRPKYLHNYCTCDTVLENNFTIDASDYHFYFGGWNSFDYKLAAGFVLDEETIGDCEITSVADKEEGAAYSSKFTFTEGYNITREFITGDTTESSFALNNEDEILLKETSIFIWKGFRKIERQYILSVGNVDIIKGTGIDSIQVFLDGVLQQKAAIKIIDEGEGERSICYKRDLLLTFDDGTTENLSELLAPARETLKTLMQSLGDMYFAKHIIDYIAISIFYNTH
jgi:hypothetical protein